jgi:dienelactone hydrolase
MLWLLCAIALAACGAGQHGPFDYDGGAPLDVRVSSSYFNGGVRISELSYGSPKGGRVPALLFVPSGGGPFAGLIVQHGAPGSKEVSAFDAEDLARLGAVVIAIDAPFARRSGEPIAFTRRDRAEQIQLIVDLRRAVDLLRARADVDDDRIACLGISYGAAMGGLLAGVEHRIAAFVLMSGDGGVVQHFSGPEDRSGPLFMLSPARRKAWLAAMSPIEPLIWVKRASAPLLFLSGRRDHLVPVRDAARYYRAAPQPKEIRWYDSDHVLPSQAWCDAAHFLGRHIGIAGSKLPECGN